jgi:hypothetical protein
LGASCTGWPFDSLGFDWPFSSLGIDWPLGVLGGLRPRDFGIHYSGQATRLHLVRSRPHREHILSASLIGRSGSSAFRLSTTTMSMSLAGSRFSSESAPGPFHHGIRGRSGTIFTAALPLPVGRSKRTNELTSSNVPRGTTFHRSVELEFAPIGFDPSLLSCRCGLPGPAELGAVNPDAVHYHGQPSSQRDDRLFQPAVPGDLYRPGLEPGPFR